MNVTAPCPACHTPASCNCMTAMTRYFKILEAVKTRKVSTLKAASASTAHLEVLSAGIDKLNARLNRQVSSSTIRDNARKAGFKIKAASLKQRGHFLKVSNSKGFVHLKYWPAHDHVSELISNPNRFGTWGDYMTFLSALLPHEALAEVEISRIDLNLDFTSDFKSLIQSIDIKNKNLSAKFDDKGGQRTGITIGTGADTIVIYDKAKKEGLTTPLARIEKRLKGSRLPSKSIFELPKSLESMTPFKGIEGLDLKLKKLVASDERNARLDEFKVYLEREGLYSARKAFNKNRNFNRDFAGLIETTKWHHQPGDLFKTHLAPFMGL